MRRLRPLALLLLACTPALAQVPNRFDGTWDVTVACAPSGDGAMGTTLRFPAQVQAGQMLGEYGGGAEGGRMRLEGPIRSDGAATFRAEGTTGDPSRAAGRPSRGAAYRYTVEAQFVGASGTGRRVEQRRCDLTFQRRR